MLDDLSKGIELMGIFIFILASIIFRLLIVTINKLNPKLLSFVNKIPDKWKGRWTVKWGVFIILVFLLAFPVIHFEINYSVSSIILGFINALTEFAFEKPKARNKKQ